MFAVVRAQMYIPNLILTLNLTLLHINLGAHTPLSFLSSNLCVSLEFIPTDPHMPTPTPSVLATI